VISVQRRANNGKLRTRYGTWINAMCSRRDDPRCGCEETGCITTSLLQ